jgi:hypothetical protein
VPAAFLPLTPDDVDRVVDMMAQLYAQGAPFDAARARQATETLLTEPEFGGVWTIDADGGTRRLPIVVLLGYSLEFGGRFGLLDELFVKEKLPRGLGADALAFAGRAVPRARMASATPGGGPEE